MRRQLWNVTPGVVLLCLAIGCSEGTGTSATAKNVTSTHPANQLPPGKYVVESRSMRLAGFFRPSACYANPADQVFVAGAKNRTTPDISTGLPVGSRLAEEYWINIADLGQFIGTAGSVEASPSDVLTCQLRSSSEGRVEIDYVGAAAGLMAMRGSRETPGAVMRCHAVEADSREPMQFVHAGVPEAKEGSITLQFEYFLSDDVAQEMTVGMQGDSNVLVMDVHSDGSVDVYPGVQKR